MVKPNSTRRKAQKPKFIEIDGHRLTEAMHADYVNRLESRMNTNSGAATSRIERLALGDFLSDYRPSSRIKDQLLDITQKAIRTSLAIGAMREYTWHESDLIRTAGCELVKKLALELYNASAKLTAIAMNVEREERTKLQDWLAQDEQVARIGRGAEVTHG